MISLETIVRPFAPVVITPPARAPRIAAIVAEPAIFSLGGKGGRSLSWQADKQNIVIKEGKSDLKESGRESTKVRAENEDDPDQFVEFCRADKITMSPKNPNKTPKPSASYGQTGDTARNNGQGSQSTASSEYSYNYPTSKSCKSPNQPSKGCA